MYINGKFLAQPITGVQRYALHVLLTVDSLLQEGQWVTNEPLVLLAPTTHLHATAAFTRLEVREIAAGHLHLWEQWRLPRATRGDRLLNLAGSAPLFKRGQICTFHDTAVFDMPQAYNRAFTCWYRLLFTVQGRLSHRLLTVSDFSKARICHHLRVDPGKVGVVHGAADHMLAHQADYGVLPRLDVTPGRYFIAVGSANPTKNFARLVEAFAGLPQADTRLVVVGGSNSAVFNDREEKGCHDARIVRAGRLTDAELKALYIHARAFVFPSVYEGFGLPPIEAMLCGCPVLAARAASIPEICGPAAAYFDPLSLTSMRKAMARALHDDTWLDSLRAAGRERASLFSWHNAATGLLQQLASLGVVRRAA
ncbi:glycosyltransferase family 4 protein [Aquabacterium sp. J223]|uniref:glycosyltransferase family 4 protein n=1 Tax=Aquabacterium sp. J223 TaxID=2898431 RepID=UPI0021AE2261|nr:glycosyltransferase family 1 protein [Aquabacterium sp. J223]UUX96767.1 glycosyltransferase family 4 protein [Aquabacterium sp. J223]